MVYRRKALVIRRKRNNGSGERRGNSMCLCSIYTVHVTCRRKRKSLREEITRLVFEQMLETEGKCMEEIKKIEMQEYEKGTGK